MTYGFGLFIAGASWLYVSIHEYGFIAAPLALIATTLFCLFFSRYFRGSFYIRRFLTINPNSIDAWLTGNMGA